MQWCAGLLPDSLYQHNRKTEGCLCTACTGVGHIGAMAKAHTNVQRVSAKKPKVVESIMERGRLGRHNVQPRCHNVYSGAGLASLPPVFEIRFPISPHPHGHGLQTTDHRDLRSMASVRQAMGYQGL